MREHNHVEGLVLLRVIAAGGISRVHRHGTLDCLDRSADAATSWQGHEAVGCADREHLRFRFKSGHFAIGGERRSTGNFELGCVR